MASEAWVASADALPALPGAYALLVTLSEPAPLPPRLAGLLAPGRYLYAGSARGPGGIRARCARHLRPKPKRWHVDWLTERACTIAALALPGGDECAVVAALRGPGFSLPVAGFGSSDCRCPAHLVRLLRGEDAELVARLLAAGG